MIYHHIHIYYSIGWAMFYKQIEIQDTKRSPLWFSTAHLGTFAQKNWSILLLTSTLNFVNKKYIIFYPNLSRGKLQIVHLRWKMTSLFYNWKSTSITKSDSASPSLSWDWHSSAPAYLELFLKTNFVVEIYWVCFNGLIINFIAHVHDKISNDFGNI